MASGGDSVAHRGRVGVIRDPAIGIAAAKCWLARWQKSGNLVLATNSFHPEECAFCEFPTERLLEAVLEFNAWAGIRRQETLDEVVQVRPAMESFLMLPRSEQDRLVHKAQYG